MIIGFFLSLFLVASQGLLGWLPVGLVIPQSVFTAGLDLVSPLSDVSWFLPVAQLLNVILWTIPIMVAVFTWKVILFLLGIVRRVDYARNRGYM